MMFLKMLKNYLFQMIYYFQSPKNGKKRPSFFSRVSLRNTLFQFRFKMLHSSTTVWFWLFCRFSLSRKIHFPAAPHFLLAPVSKIVRLSVVVYTPSVCCIFQLVNKDTQATHTYIKTHKHTFNTQTHSKH